MTSYTDQELTQAVKKSYSYSEVLRTLELSITGSSHRLIKKKISDLNLDISHFDPYKKAKSGFFAHKKHWSKKLVQRDITSYRQPGRYLRKALIESGVEYKCNKCGLDEWLNEKITLEVDHINDVPTDDRKDNLQFLCPNCHSQKPIPAKPKNKCKDCNKEIHRKSVRCNQCSAAINGLNGRKVENRPSKKVLLKEIEKCGYSATGRKYGVSDNCIRKWVK